MSGLEILILMFLSHKLLNPEKLLFSVQESFINSIHRIFTRIVLEVLRNSHPISAQWDKHVKLGTQHDFIKKLLVGS